MVKDPEQIGLEIAARLNELEAPTFLWILDRHEEKALCLAHAMDTGDALVLIEALIQEFDVNRYALGLMLTKGKAIDFG